MQAQNKENSAFVEFILREKAIMEISSICIAKFMLIERFSFQSNRPTFFGTKKKQKKRNRKTSSKWDLFLIIIIRRLHINRLSEFKQTDRDPFLVYLVESSFSECFFLNISEQQIVNEQKEQLPRFVFSFYHHKTI